MENQIVAPSFLRFFYAFGVDLKGDFKNVKLLHFLALFWILISVLMLLLNTLIYFQNPFVFGRQIPYLAYLYFYAKRRHFISAFQSLNSIQFSAETVEHLLLQSTQYSKSNLIFLILAIICALVVKLFCSRLWIPLMLIPTILRFLLICQMTFVVFLSYSVQRYFKEASLSFSDNSNSSPVQLKLYFQNYSSIADAAKSLNMVLPCLTLAWNIEAILALTEIIFASSANSKYFFFLSSYAALSIPVLSMRCSTYVSCHNVNKEKFKMLARIFAHEDIRHLATPQYLVERLNQLIYVSGFRGEPLLRGIGDVGWVTVQKNQTYNNFFELYSYRWDIMFSFLHF